MFPYPDEPSVPVTAELFADPNGTFYPPDWESRFKQGWRIRWPAGSLLNQGVRDPGFGVWLAAAQHRVLDSIHVFGKDKQRIFILVHGYNNTVAEAEPAFEAIEAKLDLRPGDGVLRFYWDSLSGELIGGGRIWFWAVGNSQLVGVNALRSVLNQFSDKEIYLISHSRGASVILSALGNPVYDPSFVRQTLAVAQRWGADRRLLWPSVPIAENRNRLHVLMLAPAVDWIDFCDESQQPVEDVPFECQQFRAFSQQLVSLRYTLNTKDPVLNKFVGLSTYFNPTRLGLKSEAGDRLEKIYPIMRRYTPTPFNDHRFKSYVASEVFDDMLADEWVAVQK
ncbi:hypothetical protein GCM10010833_08120 [Blastomonas aquatica]|uniref:Alpha/beta hydrolase n=1 Tax=Blastomonas aquatica TaxID=1510276 RepID=A0ABQ1J0C9_9SPHN|nr:hypothetical protein GCM10010833_08120 [Blastomonas aquatica]